MARIKGVPARAAGLRVRLVYFFTRRHFGRLTGRAPGGVIEPVEIYAHVPGLLRAYGRLEQATAKHARLDGRMQVLAELKATTIIGCEFCIDLASQVARRSGLSDEQLLALPRYQDSGLFTDLEKLVMDFAVAVTRTPAQVPDSLFARLREHLEDCQLVELTHHIALENMRGRFNVAFGVGAAGFSEGSVCAVPDISEPQAASGPANPGPAHCGSDRDVEWPAHRAGK